jgi:hypothetical protein
MSADLGTFVQSDRPLADRLNAMLRVAGIEAEVDCDGEHRQIKFVFDGDLEAAIVKLSTP